MFDGTTLGGSTLEIIGMLLIAFLLGYLLRLFIGNKWKGLYKDFETENYKLTNDLAASNSKIKSLEDSANFLKSELEKSKRLNQTVAQKMSSSVVTPSNTSKTETTLSKKANLSAAKASPSIQSAPKTGVTIDTKTSTKAETKDASSKKETKETKSVKTAKPAAKTEKSTAPRKNKKDDLKKIEGIGPKIEQIFNAAGIKSFDELATFTPTKLRNILQEAGPRYKMHNPKTWPKQAKLAASGNWKKLKTLQDSLKGGKET